MKIFATILSIFLFVSAPPLYSVSNTFLDYQNYNHGYCPSCNCSPCKCANGCPAKEHPPEGGCDKPDPCDPPATTCATECGLNIWYVGIGLVVIATTAVLVIGSNNGRPLSHAAP